jgi:hypothetical protein
VTFKPASLNARFLSAPGQNGAINYGVSIQPALTQPGQPYWRVIGIHHLTGAENVGNHNVYIDVLDEAGKRIDRARLVIVNNGRSPLHAVIDKPALEAGTNVPMWAGDTLTIYVSTEGLSSEQTKGFHTRHVDEEQGTTWGHHSFYVVFQKAIAGQQQPEPEPGPTPTPTPGPGPDWHLHFDIGELWLMDKCRKRPNGPFTELIAKMAGVLDVITRDD